MKTLTVIFTYLSGMLISMTGMVLFVNSDSYDSIGRVLMGIGIVLIMSSFLMGFILFIRKYKRKITTFLD